MTLSPKLGLILTPASDGDKTFLMFRTELAGDVAGSNMMIIDAKYGELIERMDNITVEALGAVPVKRTINGKPLTDNITLVPADIGVPETDITLTISGALADAKVTGDKIAELRKLVDSFPACYVVDSSGNGNIEFLETSYGGVVWQTSL